MISCEIVNKDNVIYKKILRLHQKLTGDTSLPKLTYYYSKDNVMIGYICLSIVKKSISLDWIYAPSNGIAVMNSVIDLAHIINKEGYQIDDIILGLSIDPTEKKKIVMKRINFYIKCNFRVYDIKFRPKYGPLLSMKRSIWKNDKVSHIDL